ncbi:MAG: hypothetical protein JNL32_01225 [Candidatus Kapabacteria bacterium]|nr:hypothetical protein [Candidatus Kapabacteria bacterium]
MTIAIPDNALFAPLFASAEAISADRTLRIIRTSENECARLLRNNNVDAAFLSPLAYGSEVGHTDYRIIPTKLCALRGWTNSAAIFFRPGMQSIGSIGSAHPDDFLIRIGGLLLEEQYDITTAIESAATSAGSDTTGFDAMISWRNGEPTAEGMDIGEEWFMAHERPLIAGLWVCRIDTAEEDDLFALTNTIAGSNLTEMTECVETTPHHDTIPRSGEILWNWYDTAEEDLNAILYMLYYRQLLPEIPAVKLLGRDE